MQVALAELPVTEGVIKGTDATALNSIWSPDCDVAIYQRQLGAVLQDWLDMLPARKLPKARLSLNVAEVPAAIDAVIDSHELADDPCSQMLVDDIVFLANQFARTMETGTINLRLDVVDNNACRKFHQDYVEARLLCTYRGRGSEYGLCVSAPEPDHIHELTRGSVGIFKGRRWAVAPPPAIYHRSPPIEGSGETRLLLVIDVASCDDDCDCG